MPQTGAGRSTLLPTPSGRVRAGPSTFLRAIPRPALYLASVPGLLLVAGLVLPSGALASLQDTDGSPSAPRSSARVTGTVVTSGSGVPVGGVGVEVRDTGVRATTNSQGRFDFAEVPAGEGEVTLAFTRMGLAARDLAVRVEPGGTFRLEVVMEREPYLLDPVAVLLERTRMVGDPLAPGAIPGSAFHLNRQDLEARKLAFDNVHDVLRQVPGVHVQDEEGYGLRPHIGLRGAGAERSSNITLMEDGVLIAPAPYAAPAAYYFPSTGRMDGIEIRKGASQVRYGPRTLGGAVNLISAQIPERPDWMAEVAGGQDQMMRAHVRAGDATDRTGWLIESYTLRTDGFKELQGGGDTGFGTRDFLGKFRVNSHRSAPRYQALELKLGHTTHVSNETYLGLSDLDFQHNGLLRYAASQDDVIDTDHRQFQARYFLRPGPRFDFLATAYRHEFSRNWYKLQSVGGRSLGALVSDPAANEELFDILRGADSAPDALRLRANNRGYVSQGIQTVLGLRLGSEDATRHGVELGVRVHRDHEDRLQWEDGFAMTAGRMVRTTSGNPGSQENRLGQARAIAFYLQNEARHGAWTMVPGVRYESIRFTSTDWEPGDGDRSGPAALRENSVSAVIPGVSVSYERSPWTTFYVGVHRGFGPPGPGADARTRPETSVNYEAGVRVRRAGIGTNVTAFLSDYSNILGQETLATGGTGTGDLFNGGAVHVLGVEAGLDADLGRYLDLGVGLPVRTAFTANRGVFRSSFESSYGPWGTVEAGDRLPYMPERLWSGSVGLQDPRWSLTLAWNGASRMRTEAGRGPVPENSGVDGFHVFNLSGEVSLGARAAIHGAIQNLTDERYVVSRRPAGARPGLPRTVLVGFRVTR